MIGALIGLCNLWHFFHGILVFPRFLEFTLALYFLKIYFLFASISVLYLQYTSRLLG